ncbi:MAG: diguanylate cyclase [Litorimonas sp.]
MTYAQSPKEFHKTPIRQTKSRTKVLIVTDNTHAIKDIVMELRGLDLDAQLALFDGNKLSSIPRQHPDAVLCFFSDYIERSARVVKSLRAHYAPIDIPIIGAATRATKIRTDHFDSMIFAPMHSSQIANRVRSIIRLGQMESEITRRIDTLNENFGFNAKLPENLTPRPFQILFIGKATPAFMVIVNALQQKNVNIVAAFTSFTAFDYLHEDRFDAVVMNALEQAEPALSISETMRRNSELYHIPTLFLVKSETFNHREEAYQSGASDIISIDSHETEISGRILELANYYRIHEQLKFEFNSLGGPECLDESTKLFNGNFYAAHSKRIANTAQTSIKDFSSLAIRVHPYGRDEIKPMFMSLAFSQLGLMLKNLVRMQDIVARIDEDLFVMTLPNTNAAETLTVIERIKNVVDCAAFDTGFKNAGAFTMSIEVEPFDIIDYENGNDVREHVLSVLSDDEVSLKAQA